jgi:hypothetical protein
MSISPVPFRQGGGGRDVNCMPNLEGAATWCAPLLELPDALGKRAQDRHAAILYLLAATRAEDASERNSLRRRAAELILPSRRHAGSISGEG